MKHLKKFESFEENIPVAKFQLEEDQVDDLHEQFERFIEDMEVDRKEAISYEELLDIFLVNDNGEISDDFVRFLDYLESNTDWFDFKMMDKVKNDLEIILSNMEYDYEEEEEWAQDDAEWPYEEPEETGEFADPQSEEDDEIEQLRQNTFSKEPQLNVDEILDKISASGYDSLTDEEKAFLSKQESRIVRFGKYKK